MTDLDTRRWFEDEHAASTQQVNRQFWVDLHGEEETEVGMRLEGVQSFLELYQPRGCKVDVFKHHPFTLFHRRIDGLFSL